MNHLTSLVVFITVASLTLTGGAAQVMNPDDRAQVHTLLKASPQLDIYIEYPDSKLDIEVNGKKLSVFKERKSRRRGSGVIIGRSKDKSSEDGLPYTYYVLTCRHNIQYENLDPKHMQKMNVWLYFFDYQGKGASVKIQASVSLEWFSYQLDAAIISFRSAQEMPVVPIFRKMHSNLFGLYGVAIGCPYNSPTIISGLFGVNNFFNDKQIGIVGFNSHFAPGLSGGGVYIKDGKIWKLAGLATFFVRHYQTEYAGTMGGVTRIDFVLSELQLQKKEYFAKVE
jgi:hypothetical protein